MLDFPCNTRDEFWQLAFCIGINYRLREQFVKGREGIIVLFGPPPEQKGVKELIRTSLKATGQEVGSEEGLHLLTHSKEYKGYYLNALCRLIDCESQEGRVEQSFSDFEEMFDGISIAKRYLRYLLQVPVMGIINVGAELSLIADRTVAIQIASRKLHTSFRARAVKSDSLINLRTHILHNLPCHPI